MYLQIAYNWSSRTVSLSLLCNCNDVNYLGCTYSVIRFGNILPFKTFTLCQFLRFYLIFGQILHFYWATNHCCKWQNIEKIIRSSGHTASAFLPTYIQSFSRNITRWDHNLSFMKLWFRCCKATKMSTWDPPTPYCKTSLLFVIVQMPIFLLQDLLCLELQRIFVWWQFIKCPKRNISPLAF